MGVSYSGIKQHPWGSVLYKQGCGEGPHTLTQQCIKATAKWAQEQMRKSGLWATFSESHFPQGRCNNMYSWLRQHVQCDIFVQCVFVCYMLCYAFHGLGTLTSRCLVFFGSNGKHYYYLICEEFCRKKCTYWLKFSHDLTTKALQKSVQTTCMTWAVCLPLTNPGPAIQGDSFGCCRAQWQKGVGGYTLSHRGPSLLSQRSSFYTIPPVSAARHYSCGCTPTTLLSTS